MNVHVHKYLSLTLRDIFQFRKWQGLLENTKTKYVHTTSPPTDNAVRKREFWALAASVRVLFRKVDGAAWPTALGWALFCLRLSAPETKIAALGDCARYIRINFNAETILLIGKPFKEPSVQCLSISRGFRTRRRR